MSLRRWIEHFRHNKQDRREPDWHAPVSMTPEMIAPFVRSIEQFQLGDGGGPASLIAHDANSFRCASDEMKQVVDLWFEEEKEHSRLLLGAVQRLGGTPITGHWSFSAFC